MLLESLHQHSQDVSTQPKSLAPQCLQRKNMAELVYLLNKWNLSACLAPSRKCKRTVDFGWMTKTSRLQWCSSSTSRPKSSLQRGSHPSPASMPIGVIFNGFTSTDQNNPQTGFIWLTLIYHYYASISCTMHFSTTRYIQWSTLNQLHLAHEYWTI